MKVWIYKTAIKTVKTMAQAAVGIIGGSALVSDVNWMVVLSGSVMAGIMCVLMSISDLPEVTT